MLLRFELEFDDTLHWLRQAWLIFRLEILGDFRKWKPGDIAEFDEGSLLPALLVIFLCSFLLFLFFFTSLTISLNFAGLVTITRRI
ncbi:hypothetical protein ACFX2I_014201 [Malus domestica]